MEGTVWLEFTLDSLHSGLAKNKHVLNPLITEDQWMIISAAIKGSPLQHLSITTDKCHHSGQVSLINDQLNDLTLIVALEKLELLPRDETLSIEERYAGHSPLTVKIRCYVSVSSRPSSTLQFGTWYDPEDDVSAMIVSNPTASNPNRVLITITAKNIINARKALLATLRGEKRPEKPWVI